MRVELLHDQKGIYGIGPIGPAADDVNNGHRDAPLTTQSLAQNGELN
jgi:hypothetical protein